jgi:DNA-binding IclR family transcriptional regulator
MLEDGLITTATLVRRLQLHERTARRRLRRLIRDGYAFSPDRGLYRITAAGAAVMTPVEGRR